MTLIRTIGIRHRRKKTVDGEARPTTVAIKVGDKIVCYDLETETDELDFLMARFPVEWEIVGDEDIVWFDAKTAPNGIRPHHCKWKKVSKEETATCRASHIRQTLDKKGLPITQRLVKIPTAFDGLKNGDRVAMVLGGSGDRFAAALSRHGEEIGAEVFRIPPFSLSENRGEVIKDDDHLTFVKLLEENPQLFQKLLPKDRDIIRVRENFNARMEAQRARIGCEQRVYQSLVGSIFLSEEGKFPESLIEDQFDQIKANDTILQGLIAEEERRGKEMKLTVRKLPVFQEIFESVPGCGERIAAGFIASIGGITKFAVPVGSGKHAVSKAIKKTSAKVKAFCGAHVLPDGSFPRRKAGQVANWAPLARQSLYLLTDQFNRKPDSEWGKKLLWKKAELRKAHPEPVEVEVEVKDNGKKAKKTIKKYTDGHIHKMALKWTATKFVEWMTRQWLKLEKVYES